jgi:hypothetical protein
MNAVGWEARESFFLKDPGSISGVAAQLRSILPAKAALMLFNAGEGAPSWQRQRMGNIFQISAMNLV